jgi:hypothetical protein
VTALVPQPQPLDDSDHLAQRVVELERTVHERHDALSRLELDLSAFRVRYRSEVGLLHEELDALELAIAEAEGGEAPSDAARRDADAPAGPAAARSEPLPKYTSDAVRALFRDVARTIHPDLAHDAPARERRHHLMIEANQAYARGDEERLRWILQAWERSPEAVQGSDAGAARQRLLRRMAQIEDELERCARTLADLHDTPLWKLKAMVDEAAARGKDLVGDMVRRLQRDIRVARNRLEAIQWRPDSQSPRDGIASTSGSTQRARASAENSRAAE